MARLKRRNKNAPGVYAAWIGCGLGVENSLIGLYDSYDKAYSAILGELEFEYNRQAWLGIERWELNSNDPSDIWEFSARKLWKSIEEAKECTRE